MGWIKGEGNFLNGAEFRALAARAAGVLQAFGVGEGDGVALFLRNEPAFFVASMGAGMLGAYSVPINWHSTAAEAGVHPVRFRRQGAVGPCGSLRRHS